MKLEGIMSLKTKPDGACIKFFKEIYVTKIVKTCVCLETKRIVKCAKINNTT